MPGYAVDRLPIRLLKAYSNAVHALAFAEEGRLRLTRLDLFRSSPDSRRDAAEGESSLFVPGQVPFVVVDVLTGNIRDSGTRPGHFDYRGTFTNPTYVFCTSDARVSRAYLASRFGPHLVEITEPAAFSLALHQALTSAVLPDHREVLFLDGCPVRYDKGSVGEDPASGSERLRLELAQKPLTYEEEHEYRFAAAVSGLASTAPEYLDVKLTGYDQWARVIALPSSSAA